MNFTGNFCSTACNHWRTLFPLPHCTYLSSLWYIIPWTSVLIQPLVAINWIVSYLLLGLSPSFNDSRRYCKLTGVPFAYIRVLESVYASICVPKCQEIASRVCPNTQNFRRQGGHPSLVSPTPGARSLLRGSGRSFPSPPPQKKPNVWLRAYMHLTTSFKGAVWFAQFDLNCVSHTSQWGPCHYTKRRVFSFRLKECIEDKGRSG